VPGVESIANGPILERAIVTDDARLPLEDFDCARAGVLGDVGDEHGAHGCGPPIVEKARPGDKRHLGMSRMSGGNARV